MELSKLDDYIKFIHKYTESAHEKITQIRAFIDMSFEASKERGEMYGSIFEIETRWQVLDQIYFILENMTDEAERSCMWGTFLVTKGYGAKNASTVIKEKKLKDPYSALVKLRNEYEEWRKKKLATLRTGIRGRS